jgi:hypothetical protein
MVDLGHLNVVLHYFGLSECLLVSSVILVNLDDVVLFHMSFHNLIIEYTCTSGPFK